MAGKGDQSVPYILPIARRRSFYLENFTSLPEVFDIFKFQGWNDFLRISEDIYTGLVPVFYSTLSLIDEDNTSLQSIVGSFELQVLPSDIAQITNMPNEGIVCRVGER